ncbi:MAG: DUF1269 domain-containing protein [bacterium]|jgi:uncharacterized membrane protein
MSDLVVISYPGVNTAGEARNALYEMSKEHLVELEDAVVVVKDAEGKVQLHQAVNLTTAGAASGALWGSLVGMLFLNPLLGAAVGAGSGALGGYFTDIGVDDAFAKQVGGNLSINGSALLVLFRKVTADKVVPRLAHFGGTVLKTSFSDEQEAKLRTALTRGDSAPIVPETSAAASTGESVTDPASQI